MVGTVIAKVAGSSLGATYTMPAADGASGEFLKTDGSTNLSFGSAAAGFNSVQTPSTGTYNKTAGTTKIIVEVQGGGGGASPSNGVSWGACGGGGSYVKQYIDVSAISTGTVVVGVAGTSGTSPTVGGTSSFSCTGVSISCLGGGAASYAGSPHSDGGVGGVATASGANVLINGQNGRPGYGYASKGGDSGLGLGGSTYLYDDRIGPDATGYGGGGGVGLNTNGTAGDATVGIVIVWEYK